MGYSVSIRVKDPALRKKAVAFMRREFRAFSEVIGKEMDTGVKWGPIEGPLAYDRRSSVIGFDYSHMSEPESHYIYSILRWMALRFGDTKKFKGKIGERPFVTKKFKSKKISFRPFVFYVKDGCEHWAVVVTDDGEPPAEGASVDATYCDQDGWQPWWHVTEKLFGFGKKKAIRAELERLSKAWNETNARG